MWIVYCDFTRSLCAVFAVSGYLSWHGEEVWPEIINNVKYSYPALFIFLHARVYIGDLSYLCASNRTGSEGPTQRFLTFDYKMERPVGYTIERRLISPHIPERVAGGQTISDD